ncbi:MAG: GntR family transcriptional regulator [Candidatus Binatia bacterium]|jgi:GntR family transcriptional regulator
MIIRINYKSGKPPYLQIGEQIRHAAASGALKSGEAVPTIRGLAEKLQVNRNTVAKAYTELEREGILETKTGRGSFLRENQTPLKKAIRQGILNDAIDAAIVQAHHFQIKDEELRTILEKRLESFRKKREQSERDQKKEKS